MNKSVTVDTEEIKSGTIAINASDAKTIKDFFKSYDNVDKPKHYNQGKFETIEVIEDWLDVNGKAMTHFEGHCYATGLKYLGRIGNKANPLEDLQKALWYFNRMEESMNERISKSVE